MTKGLNLRTLKNENRSLILYTLGREGAMSRKELAHALGLTPAAVTKICNALLEEGMICESGATEQSGAPGRRERLLSLQLDGRYCFGIHAEKDAVTLSLSSLSGKLMKKKRIPFTDDVATVVAQSKLFLQKAQEQTPYRGNIVGCGVCIIGSLNENDFGIWKEPDLQKTFEEAFSLPVVIKNNVKAFAQAELLYGENRSLDSVLFLKWGPGVGSAITSGGKVFSGSDASMAEIGHYIVNPSGRKCRCGRYGCLETEVSEEAILQALDSKLSLDETLQNCNNSIVNIFDHKIDAVALALVNTATILNTRSIVLFGTVFRHDFAADKLIRQCNRYNAHLSRDMIRLSALNGAMDYIGTTAVCAQKFFFER